MYMLFMAFNYVSRTSLAMLSCIFGGREATTGKASGVRGLSLQLKLFLPIILHISSTFFKACAMHMHTAQYG